MSHIMSFAVKANQFMLLGCNSESTCPAIITYECTALNVSGGSTVWKGTAFFSCENDHEISLQSSNNSVKNCNDGNLYASGWIENRNYVSRLNVTVSSDIIGKSIECYRDESSQSINIVKIGHSLIGGIKLISTVY